MNLPDSISQMQTKLNRHNAGENVSIRINLIKDEVTYKFDPQSGSKENSDKNGTYRSHIKYFSSAESTRLGYDLVGWQQYNDINGNGICLI